MGTKQLRNILQNNFFILQKIRIFYKKTIIFKNVMVMISRGENEEVFRQKT